MPLINGVPTDAESFGQVWCASEIGNGILFMHMSLLVTPLNGKFSILHRQVKLTKPEGKLSYHERDE